jgi:carboxyl-terminal processing protease
LALTACRVSTTRQEARSLPGGILLLRFDDFDWSKMHWFSHQLKAHRDAPGLIVDLRHNPGGTLISMDFMVGDLVDHDFTYACSINRAGHRWKLKALTLGSARFRGPVAVLVDQTSGSAAELFAAVLQEQHRARIIGRKTDGDVLLARFRELADGGMLEYSYFDLRTAGGRRLEGSGVTPDVILPPPTLEELQAGRDLDVEAAVRLLSQP